MKQTLSVRDFAMLYNIANREVEDIKKRQPRYEYDDTPEIQLEKKKQHKKELKTNGYYQDLLRIREQLGTINVELETPKIKLEEIKVQTKENK
jgi:hypothetical protein